MKKIRKPNINKVSALAVIAVGTRIETVLSVWELAYKYQSWDLATFTTKSPSAVTIWKVRRIVEELS